MLEIKTAELWHKLKPGLARHWAILAYIKRKSATIEIKWYVWRGKDGGGERKLPHKQIKRIDKMARVDPMEEECAVVIGYATREISYNYLVS